MRALTAWGLSLVLLLSACSAGSDRSTAEGSAASESPGGSAGASPTESPGPAVEPSADAGTTTAPARGPAPVPDPPAATNDRAGRVAFARYVLQAWIYALNTNDVQPLLDISGPKPCTGCGRLAKELESREKAGWYVALKDVQVSRTDVAAQGRTARAAMSVSIPESNTFNEDGTFRSTSPAHPRATFEVEMVHRGKRFRLTAFSLY